MSRFASVLGSDLDADRVRENAAGVRHETHLPRALPHRPRDDQVALSLALLASPFVLPQRLANVARLDLGIAIDSAVMFSVPRLGRGPFDRWSYRSCGARQSDKKSVHARDKRRPNSPPRRFVRDQFVAYVLSAGFGGALSS